MGSAAVLCTMAAALGGGFLCAVALTTGHRSAGWAGVVVALAGYGTGLVLALLAHQWPVAAVNALALAVILWLLWRFIRPSFRRALGLAGAKSRARIAALVAKVRQSAKPRPVLRPAPGGVKA